MARVCDLPGIVDSLRGKVEFEVSEEGREGDVLVHLLRRAIAETFRARLGNADLSGLACEVRGGRHGRDRRAGAGRRAAQAHRRGAWAGQGASPGSATTAARSSGRAAAAIEFALEGLYLMRRLSKDEVPGRTVYGG